MDLHRSNSGPRVDGTMGSASSASLGQLASQLGQFNITSNQPKTNPVAQTSKVPDQTSEVNLVKSTQLKNPQQLRGKKKNKKKILVLSMGLLRPKKILMEALRRRIRIGSLTIFLGNPIYISLVSKDG
jgi:hypothetical protein